MRKAALVTIIIVMTFAVVRDKIRRLPDHGGLPEWAFVDEAGEPIGTAQLRGKPWVANFLFTTCPGACPPLARATFRLQEKIKTWLPPEERQKVAIVSITVDPVVDTPEKLAAFGEAFQADPEIWKFARGEYEAMEELVTGGFLQGLYRADRNKTNVGTEAAKEALKNPTPMDTAHSVHFVLMDTENRIRGFYEQDGVSLGLLSEDLERLTP